MISDPICMACGKKCAIREEVYTLPHRGGLELWCYCQACDQETFHPIEKLDPRLPQDGTMYEHFFHPLRLRS